MTSQAVEPSAELLDAARDLLDHCDIVDVRPIRIEAGLHVDDPNLVATLAFNPVLEHASGEGVYQNRITFSFGFKGSSGGVVANMEFVLVVDWDVEEGFTPDTDAAGFVASTTGYFAAFPYARELAQSCTARLGLDPLVLGTLDRGSLQPGGVSVATRPARNLPAASLDDQESE